MQEAVYCETARARRNDLARGARRQRLRTMSAIAAGASVLLLLSPTAHASQIYLVSAHLSAGGSGGGIFRLEDRNGDGDALDLGENVLWGRGINEPGDLHHAGGGAVLAADPSGRIVRLKDLNGDGDALDVGESIVWAEGFDVSWGIDVRGAGEVLVTDFSRDRVEVLRDLNGDGDALDLGEATAFAAGLNSPVGILFIPEPSSATIAALSCLLLLGDWVARRG